MDMSAADIRAITDRDGYGDGMFGGNGLWFLALLFLFGNGGFGWGGRGNPVTEADLCTSQNFNDLQNAVGRLSDSQAAIARQTDNAICSSTYELASKIDACCCNTQLGVQQVRYDMAVQNGDLKSLIHSEAEATRAMIQQDKIESLQAQVNQLNLQAQLCGVVRYPTSMAYTAGYSPFCGYTNGCGCASI